MPQPWQPMITKGSLVVVSDHERMESYIAELLEDYHCHRGTSPTVRIRRMLVYPKQTAIIYNDIITERTPLNENDETRMPFVCEWPLDTLPDGSYPESVDKALGDYITEARETNRYDVLAVLARHQRGEYRRGRQLTPIHI
jgi:hypothetical protein